MDYKEWTLNLKSYILLIANQIKKDWFILIIGTLSFSSIAIFNGWPLITSDTGTYLSSGLSISVPNDRPIFYGILIFFTSLRVSLWLTVFVQCFIITFLLYQILENYFPRIPKYGKIITLLLTSFGTSVPWYCAQIMPDIFTPIIFLAILNAIKSDYKWRKIYFTIVFIALLTHNSHIIIGCIFGFLLWVITVVPALKTYLNDCGKQLLKYTLLAWICICTTNFIAKKGFTLSKVSHVFLMGKLSENGILNAYLKDHCAKKQYKLCNYIDKLPQHGWDFVWDASGPLANSGGWDSSKKEYNEIILGTLTEAKFIKLHITESFKATLKQAQLYQIGDGVTDYAQGAYPKSVIQDYFPRSINSFLKNKQNNQQLNFEVFSSLYYWIIMITTVLAFLALIIRFNKQRFFIFLLTLVYVIINAFATASFANILPRLNSRVLWLLPFICISIFLHLIVGKKQITNDL